MKFVVPLSSIVLSALLFAAGVRAEEVITGSQGLSNSSGLCAVGAETGKSYASYNAALPLAPASIQKLLVSAAALTDLGPVYSTSTEVFGEAPLAGNKVSKLFIKAGVDAGFTTERVYLLGRMIRTFGIAKIAELSLDDSALVDSSERKGTRAFLSGVSAFGLNWNSYTVRACSGEARNRSGAASLMIDPFEFPIALGGKVRIGEGTNVSASESANGGSVTASGVIERGKCGEEYVSAVDTRRYTASVIRGILKSAGVEAEAVSWKRVPSDTDRLFSFRSRPLEELLKDMNYFSNNNMAEMFAALLGAENGKFSRQLGMKRIEEFVQDSVRKYGERGSAAPRMNIVDSSGLSPANKASAQTFCAVLRREYARTDQRIPFFGALPQFGVSGTMKKRLMGVSGRAKTGSLSNVSSLAGVVYGRTEPIVFAIIQNQVGDTAKAKDIEDRIVTRLSAL